MGQRLAPVLAIAFMSKIENSVLERKPTLYRRYIDDCLIVCSTQAEMDACFELLNRQSPDIKFTREKPEEGWLPFLNIQVRLEKGEYQTRWYRKPSNKNILVHYLSAHSSKTKRSVVANMFRTAKTVSSNRALGSYSVNLARAIARANGYPDSTARPWYRRRNPVTRGEESNKIPLCIPFVCEELSSGIRNCVRRAGLENYLRVVDIPPLNLRHRLVRSRAFGYPCDVENCAICSLIVRGDCMRSGVIYLIRCEVCGEEYIRGTGRPLRL